MKIKLNSVMVDDQTKALAFYTDKLGFTKKHDIPVGGEARWLTLTSPEGHDDFAPAMDFQKALRDAGIPLTMFAVGDIEAEYARLTARGVSFRKPPTDVGSTKIAVFDDTCGNWIQIYEG
jgi:predicted enzyme related to lactoylglutathione lyase